MKRNAERDCRRLALVQTLAFVSTHHLPGDEVDASLHFFPLILQSQQVGFECFGWRVYGRGESFTKVARRNARPTPSAFEVPHP